MKNVTKTNRFFTTNIYPNLLKLAKLPISWAFVMDDDEGRSRYAFPDGSKLILVAALPLILLPTTLATGAIALCLAALSAIVHSLSLIVAGIMDCCSKDEDSNYSPNYGTSL